MIGRKRSDSSEDLEAGARWPSIHAENFSDSAPRSRAPLPSAGCRAAGDRRGPSPRSRRPPPAANRILVVVNARVLTSDTAAPRAEAFAVKNGRFVAVGSTSDVRNLATRRTQVIDAQRMTVTPGFIDAHCHPSGVQELYGVNTQPAHRARDPGGDQAEGGGDAARGLGHRLHVRRHEARSAADAQGSRRSDDASTRCRSRTAAATRTSTTARRSSWPASPRRHARPARRPLLQGERRAERPRRRERAQRLQPRRQARDVHAGAAARSRAQRHGAHVEAVQRAPASPSVHNAGTSAGPDPAPTKTAARTAS